MSADYATMPAGREMDALVCERVMGWKIVPALPSAHGGGQGLVMGAERDGPAYRLMTPAAIPRYSTDIAAAWQVVERLDLVVSPTLVAPLEGATQWCAGVFRGTYGGGGRLILDGTFAEAETAPLAISRAALLAIESTPAE